ncbi:uncharacterized protein PAC_15004 [Phialocephala subalpina]|uniref:DUF7730 domain-containing protein n=1 Tax=Phialocephala subalpina TaxID=576137 RepID=A0A1L7XJB3_9HELO|nr:uncharacterized protein PAC_15004 [Phialocephala subalpina]
MDLSTILSPCQPHLSPDPDQHVVATYHLPSDITSHLEIEQSTLMDFRTKLDGLKKSERALTARMHALEEASRQTKCFFLEKIPVELRNLVYEYLLVNKILASPKSINRVYTQDHDLLMIDHIYEQRYGLSLAILRTCHKIYQEASQVLYGSNTFILESFWTNTVLCPLFRYASTDYYLGHHSEHSLDLKTPGHISSQDFECHLQVVKKVRRWRVLLSTHQDKFTMCPTPAFVFLCRAMCDAPPQSLEVQILPKGPVLTPIRQGYYQPSRLLQPLLLLRNINMLAISQCAEEDAPQYDTSRIEASHIPGQRPPALHDSLVRPPELPWELISKLKCLVQHVEDKTPTPVVLVFKMYNRLLPYAQAFERNDNFRAAMEPWYGHVRKAQIEGWGLFQGGWVSDARSMFKSELAIGPVEYHLVQAASASEENNLAAFISSRYSIITLLGNHYKRIYDAAENISRFIKKEKVSGGLFDLDRAWERPLESKQTLLGDALVQLYDYIATFHRDRGSGVDKYILLNPRRWHLAYCNLPREVLTRQLEENLENWQLHHSFPGLLNIFKEIVNDMNKQYLTIRKFRKEMFDDDPPGLYYSFDRDQWCEKHKCDEIIDWTVHEPHLTPGYLNPDISDRDRSDGSDDPYRHLPFYIGDIDDIGGVGYEVLSGLTPTGQAESLGGSGGGASTVDGPSSPE